MDNILDKVQIVILAAGKGKRMESDDPKALTPLKNKPFLKHLLDTISELNFPIPPVIVVGHKKERIFEVIGPDQKYAHQAEQLGTGHAVMSAKNDLHPDYDAVLVLSTDQPHISKETILNIVHTHMTKKPAITIATVKLPDFKDWREGIQNLGRIVRDKDGKILRNVENKDATEEQRQITEINPAIYMFDREWLWQNIDKIKNDNAQGEYYLTDLIGLAVEQGKQVESVFTDSIVEGLQPNFKAELQMLEDLLADK